MYILIIGWNRACAFCISSSKMGGSFLRKVVIRTSEKSPRPIIQVNDFSRFVPGRIVNIVSIHWKMHTFYERIPNSRSNQTFLGFIFVCFLTT